MTRLSASGTGLEIGEHPRFEKRWRVLQRCAFSLMAVLVVSGLLGLLGSGPLSRIREAAGGSARAAGLSALRAR